MVVSGILVNTAPDKFEHVKSELLKMDGIEINAFLDDYRIVVVVQSKNMEDEAVVSRRIAEMEGVLGINLAYHHFGEDEQA